MAGSNKKDVFSPTEKQVRHLPGRKKPAFWVILASPACLAAAAVLYFLTQSPAQNHSSASQGSKSLGALSEEECVAFVQESGIGLPPGIAEENTGSYLKSQIQIIEDTPYLSILGADEENVAYTERLRLAVIRHDGFPWLQTGVYAFDKNLYMNALSSYIPFDGTGLLYCIGDDFFTTAAQENVEEGSGGSAEENLALTFPYWRVEEIPENAWDDENQFFPENINLHKYTTRLKFTGYGTDQNTALFLMDGEVWLVRLGKYPTPVWSIYKLKLTDLPLDAYAPKGSTNP